MCWQNRKEISMPEDIRPERDSPDNLEARVDEIEDRLKNLNKIEGCLENLKFSKDELEAFDKVTKKLRNIFSRCIH
jgi:hypothetical protein